MEFSGTQEIILRLKEVKIARNLSISQIKQAVEESGGFVSETTIRRVFAPNSEETDSFSYESTIRPIAQAILITGNDNDATAADRKAFMAISKYKDIMIEEKTTHIEKLEERIEKLQEKYEKRFEDYEKEMKFMRDQIDLKDARMDRKDDQIEKLLDQVLQFVKRGKTVEDRETDQT